MGSDKKVLIVDDELSILTGLSKALHDLCDFHGEIMTVVNGREAIYAAGHCFYDICFLDIRLPDINGLEVMEDINKISPETEVILMSASYMWSDMENILRDGEVFYIDKPFNFTQINHVMKLIFEGKCDFSENKENGKQKGSKGKRKSRRQPMSKVISFYVKNVNLMEFKGGVIDISYSGVGIQTYYPLECGNIVYFNKGVAYKAGIVVWSIAKTENNCRAGIEFIK